jgi:hypothetical protein
MVMDICYMSSHSQRHAHLSAISSALLYRRLLQMEKHLLKTQAEVQQTFDQEICHMHELIENLKPSQMPAQRSSSSLEIMPSIQDEQVEFYSMPDEDSFTIREALPDKDLEKATVDELNAALAAAFQMISVKR